MDNTQKCLQILCWNYTVWRYDYMCELLELIDDEKSVFKVGVTVAFAERYGFTYASVANYFDRKWIYNYIDLYSSFF